MAENPWLTLWRTFWLDLPLAWARRDRSVPVPLDGAADHREDHRRRRAGSGPPAGAASHDEPDTPVEAVALGLGCGDYSEEVLG